MNFRRNGFVVLAIALGLFLIITSIVDGSSIVISIAKGIQPLRSFDNVRAYVWRALSDFVLPLAGGIVLVYLGLDRHNSNLDESIRKVRSGGRKALKNEKKRVLDVFLNADEKKVMVMIGAQKGGALQSDIVIKTGYSKVKVHRILKGLENKGLIRRGRLGITNRVMLSN